MQDLLIEKQVSTPYVNFSASNRALFIEGNCIPENAFAFFTPLINWLSQLFETSTIDRNEEYIIDIKCNYYNSASAKMLVFFFETVAEIQKKGYNLRVIWCCSADDTDLADSVKDFTSITDADIEIMKL